LKSFDVSEDVFSEISLQKSVISHKPWYLPSDFEGNEGKAGFTQSFCELVVAICRRLAEHVEVQGPFLFETARCYWNINTK